MKHSFSTLTRPAAVAAALAAGFFTTACAQPQNGSVKVIRHTAPLNFTRFSDPMENAFFADVPQGWRVFGGVNRQSPIETRPALTAVSPEGVMIGFGSAAVPTFIAPNYMLNQTGFPEGSRYPNNYGGYMMVRRYVPGAYFAEEYAHNVAQGAGCGRPQILDRRDRPDLGEPINMALYGLASVGATVQVNYGEVAFECSCNGAVWRGQYIAGTLFSQTSSGLAIWALYGLHGYFAPEGRGGMAQAALRRLLATHRVNPSWATMQGSITRRSSEIMARSNEEIARTITQGYWNRQATMAEVFRKGANARRGTTDLADPNTGETWNVWGNHNHWWRKPGSDEIIGTDDPNPPAQGFFEISQY